MIFWRLRELKRSNGSSVDFTEGNTWWPFGFRSLSASSSRLFSPGAQFALCDARNKVLPRASFEFHTSSPPPPQLSQPDPEFWSYKAFTEGNTRWPSWFRSVMVLFLLHAWVPIVGLQGPTAVRGSLQVREIFIDNLLVRVHLIIEMSRPALRHGSLDSLFQVALYLSCR
jgi:hypothetical protein